ncbi:MAG: hypothetical protein K0R57_2551 [Paenibacillaceae bacterium]|jgi:uncharacterized RDD family membrane protein YckC|nr:hypothetical protein [Paenibacillaceae bacterium]
MIKIINPIGFKKRFEAIFLNVLVYIIIYVIEAILYINISQYLLSVLFIVQLVFMGRGMTLGKWWVGIKVVKLDGTNAGFFRMLLRTFSDLFINVGTLGIGLIINIGMISLRRDKRVLHDLIAGTYVTNYVPTETLVVHNE